MITEPEPSHYSKKKLTLIFEKLAEMYPNAISELRAPNSFCFLIAVMLSAQSTDKQVNKVTEKLFKIANTIDAMIALEVNKIESLIKSLGLYKTKAKNVHGCSQMLKQQYAGKIPKQLDQLVKLPGVGRKTAQVVRNQLFDEPVIAVDTHVFRLANRLKIAPAKTTLKVELALDKIIPEHLKSKMHLALILHGRYICVARNPKCHICKINHLCQADEAEQHKKRPNHL